MTFSDKLHDLRTQHHLSQEQLANQLGVSRQTVSKWEIGTAVPDTVNILQLSKLFRVTTDYLLHDSETTTDQAPQRCHPRFRKAETLFWEKGYLAGYILMWKDLCSIIGCFLFGLVWITVLESIGPLSSFPIQTFLLPIAAGIVAFGCLIKLFFHLVLTIKFKNLDQK